MKQFVVVLQVLLLTGLVLPTLALLTKTNAHAVGSISSSGTVVGTTYYGGHFDDGLGSWVIDNNDQCTRIANGEFSAASLSAVVDSNCDDDNGLGYMHDWKLHNKVSYAELSIDATAEDFSALGNLPAGTRIEIEYNNKCVIAEKLDVGTGGSAVEGVHRSLDLWWQTARTLGFTNGFDLMTVRQVPQATPLSPLGKTTPCGQATAAAATVPPPPPQQTAPPKPEYKQVTLGGISKSIDRRFDTVGATQSLRNSQFANQPKSFSSFIEPLLAFSALISVGISFILWKIY